MGWTSGKPVSYTRLSQVLSSVGGKIEVIPCWKWMLGIE